MKQVSEENDAKNEGKFGEGDVKHGAEKFEEGDVKHGKTGQSCEEEETHEKPLNKDLDGEEYCVDWDKIKYRR